MGIYLKFHAYLEFSFCMDNYILHFVHALAQVLFSSNVLYVSVIFCSNLNDRTILKLVFPAPAPAPDPCFLLDNET